MTVVTSAGFEWPRVGWIPYCLCNIVDNDCTVGISVVHGSERLVAFLSCRVPYFELYGGGVVEGNGLGEEGGADGGLPVIIELVLRDLLIAVSY